jgi:hypothetical protein
MSSQEISTEQKENNKAAMLEKMQAAQDVQNIKVEDCPVRPIGHSSGFYYFISPVGQQRVYKFNEFTFNGILSLFEGDVSWLEDNFPRSGGNRRRAASNGFDIDEVTTFLMNACKAAGLYNSEMSVRRVGIWREDQTEENGFPSIVVHSGDTLMINGKAQKSGIRIGDSLYESAPKIQQVADKAATEKEAQFMLDTLRMWNFSRKDIDPKLLAGFIAQAMLGAAPKWRVHCMVTAPSGSGKSWLTDTIANIFGSGAHDIKNNFTEAGLRQSLTNEARCMILDEAEHEEGGGRVKAVVELLRHMSGGKGSSGVRGSAGGMAQSFTVTGCAYLSSILHVPLKPQDKNRILHLTLLPFDKNTPTDQVRDLEKRMLQLKNLSPALRRRMVDSWHRYLAALEIYHPAFMQAGLNSRAADHMTTLYAGAAVFLQDGDVCSDSVQEDVESASIMIRALKEQTTDNEGQQCLNHFYTSTAESWKNGERQTIGQLVADCIKENNKAVNKKLGPHGIRYEPADYVCIPPTPPELIVSNSGQGLEKIFTGTRWSNGVWSQALSYLGGTLTKTYRFAGAAARGISIPKEHWPEVDD